MDEEKIREIQSRIIFLQEQHQSIDRQIIEISADSEIYNIEVQRLKKQKLKVKDQISQLQNMIYPDTIA